MSERIQRQQVKGWRMPKNAVFVDLPSIFGNPFTCGRPHQCHRAPCGCCPPEPFCCVDTFREYLMSGLEDRQCRSGTLFAGLDALRGYPRRTALVARLPELRGKDLVSWCPLEMPSHADVLLELANA